MRVLALEPHYGGSHKAFLDGWTARSRHDWCVLGLPPYKWKWRMRHAAIHFATDVVQRAAAGERWDAVLCSDMLNLAEFRGLAPQEVSTLPSVVYFHENQLTYPVRHESERDYHFVLTNLTTALAAREVWFNSAFHRDEFLAALPGFLRRMPDHQPLEAVAAIRTKSVVQPPGVDAFPPRAPRAAGPLRILWAARWEHDKNPACFFAALELLAARGVDFRLSVVGEQFRDAPPVFEQARRRFADRIDRWGYQQSRADYEAALREADVAVSTADHEFFGIGLLEAVAAGAFPCAPRRLAYPETLSPDGEASPPDAFFYEGGAEGLAKRLTLLAGRCRQGDLWAQQSCSASNIIDRFTWSNRAPQLDAALARHPRSPWKR